VKVKRRHDRSSNEPAAELLGGYDTDSMNLLDLRRTIELRAYELWLQRGCGDGGAVNDWLQAEAEVHSRSDGSNNLVSEIGGAPDMDTMDTVETVQRATHIS
jgi:Protein of unknown function (DUF2934)